MSLLRYLLPALFLAVPAMAEPVKYTIDPMHTHILWKADHLGFSHTFGQFETISGFFTLDEAKPENSHVEISVKTGSIHTDVPALVDKLKSNEFFSTDEFPEAKFISNKVEVLGKDKAKVYGDLTLHGKTKPLVLDVTLNKIGESFATKKKAAGFSATTTILRSQFGISFGVPMVSDSIPLMIEAEGGIDSPPEKK